MAWPTHAAAAPSLLGSNVAGFCDIEGLTTLTGYGVCFSRATSSLNLLMRLDITSIIR